MTVQEKTKKSVKTKKSELANLLKEEPVRPLKEGDKVEGTIVDITSHAAYVDLGNFGAGIIYGKEIKEGFGLQQRKLGIGDKITAAVVLPENEEGYVELSIAEAVKEEAWKDLREKQENKEVIKVRILDANKGGLMVEINGIRGFMPVSQLTSEHYPRVEDGDKNKILEILKSYVDTEMNVCILVADEEEDKLIVSEKEAYKDKEKELISEFKVGDIVEGEISGVVDFGAFIKFLPPSKQKTGSEEDELEGLVHISQLDWQLIDNPRDVVKVGDRVKAKIISIDGTRISLSIRDLKNDPWMSVEKKYKVGGEYEGRVDKINHFGAFVYLDDDIHGLAHVSGFPGYPKKGIDEIVEIDKKYIWKVMSLEPNAHRMGLKFVGEIDKKKKVSSPQESEEKKSAQPEEKSTADKKGAESKEEEKAKAKPSAKDKGKDEGQKGEKKEEKKATGRKAKSKKEAKTEKSKTTEKAK